MFLILADFLSTLGGGEKRHIHRAGNTGRGVPVRDSCWAPHRAPRPVRQGQKSGQARKTGRGVPVRDSCRAPLTVRPCRYGKETRAGRQGKHGRGVPVRDSCRAPHSAPRPVRQGKKSGPGRRAAGQVGTGETVALCTYVTTS